MMAVRKSNAEIDPIDPVDPVDPVDPDKPADPADPVIESPDQPVLDDVDGDGKTDVERNVSESRTSAELIADPDSPFQADGEIDKTIGDDTEIAYDDENGERQQVARSEYQEKGLG